MTQSQPSTTRQLMRSKLRLRRQNLSRTEQTTSSLNACKRLSRQYWFRDAQHVAFYWPSDGELSPLPLLQLALTLGKTCYLPVVQKRTMVFRRYQKGGTLRNNHFGIPEPLPKERQMSPLELDLICLPLVGFDSKGNRLGMGGGFYDKTLANAQRNGPKLVGLAHQCQRMDSIPIEEWDIPLHMILTNRAIYRNKI